jgi:predicted RND superfamily exporter protein
VAETKTQGAAGAPDDPEERLALKSNRFGEWVLKWRLAIIVSSVFVTALLAIGIPYLSFNPDTRSFFGPKNPERIALDHLEQKYAQATNVILILTPKSGNVFTPEFLALNADLTRKGWQIPYAFRVDSLTNFQELKADGDDLQVSPLYPRTGTVDPAGAARIRERAMANSELVGRWVSKQGDVAAIAIYVNRPNKKRGEVREVADAARALAAEITRTHSDIEVRLTGGVMGDLAFAEAGQRDVLTLVPLMAIVILGVLLVGMRSWTVTFVTSTVIALTVISTMGIFGWLGTVLNTVTAAAPPVIMTLFFADCVHFVMSAVQQQTHGRSREASIIETIRLNLMPTLIKTGTTVIGFLSLNFSDSPPLNQLGNIVAVGSLIGCGLTVTLIPALLSYMRLPSLPQGGWMHTALSRMSDWIIARNKRFLYGFAALFPIALLLIPQLNVDDNFVRYFDKSFQFRTDTDYLEQRLTGLHGLIYSVPAGKAEGITEPEYLRRLDAFGDWYRKQDHVAHVTTLADIVKRLNKAMNKDDPAFETIPDDKKLIAQYLMLYELSLPAGQDLSSIVDVGRSESLMTVRLTDVSSKSIIALADAGEKWLADNAKPQATIATGLSVVYSHITERNIQAMMTGTAISVVLVSLLMGFALRNWQHGWISLVVNLTPAGMAFGVWSLTGSEVNLAISVVTSITYGIVVDDTVHTMTKYRWARQMLGLSPVEAARETLTYTGGAVILSSVALAMGFALLGLSSFNITSVMGTLSALIIALAAVAELLLLPGLLIMFDKDKV